MHSISSNFSLTINDARPVLLENVPQCDRWERKYVMQDNIFVQISLQCEASYILKCGLI